MSRSLYFDELQVGMRWGTAGATVTEESIIRFSLEWDFQEFHVDRELARASVFGSLVASGLHSLCLAYRLFNEMSPTRATALAGLGIENLRWKAPVRPGDTIRSDVTVAELVAHECTDRGRARLRFLTFNQDGTELMQFDLICLIRCRPDESRTRAASGDSS